MQGECGKAWHSLCTTAGGQRWCVGYRAGNLGCASRHVVCVQVFSTAAFQQGLILTRLALPDVHMLGHALIMHLGMSRQTPGMRGVRPSKLPDVLYGIACDSDRCTFHMRGA